MDTLVLKSLKFRGLHGFFEDERISGNDFEIDLIFKLSLQEAASSESLDATIDYSKAQEIVASIMNGEPVLLLETLALKIGEKLFSTFKTISSLKVVVRKLNPPMEGDTLYAEVRMKWPR